MDELLLIKMKNLAVGLFAWLLLAIPILALVWMVRNLRTRLKSEKPGNAKAVLLETTVDAIFVGFLIVSAFTLLATLPHPHDPPRRLYCEKNLKVIWKAHDEYAADHDGYLPPIDNVKNNFIMSGGALYPEYVDKIEIFGCPSDAEYWPAKNFHLESIGSHSGFSVGDAHPDCIIDMSYNYLGWIVTSDEEAEAFFEAYNRLSPEEFDKDIVVANGRGNGGGNIIYRLRKKDDPLYAKLGIDISTVPVMWDRPSRDITEISHVPAGYNMLYLDGHIEFIHQPGRLVEGRVVEWEWDDAGAKFPITETMARLLEERPRDSIPDCWDPRVEWKEMKAESEQ